MKLLNFKEFKENAPSEVTLKDYLSYLDSKRLEVEEAMAIAKEFGLTEVASPELNEKMAFLDKFLEIIDGNKKKVIMQSIDKLSLEDLQLLYSDKIDVYTRELDEIKSKLRYYDAKIETEKESYSKKMLDNGYAEEYFEQEDTADFFENPMSAFEYVKFILEQDEINEEELKQMLSIAIRFELKKANKKANDNVIKCMIDGIVAIFVKCYKLNKMLSNKSEYIANSLLSNNGISKIIVELFGKDITDNLFLDMQNIVKESYEFFKYLPKDVQEKLRDERINGDCFKGLFDYYYSLLNGYASQFKPFDTKKLDRLIEERTNVKEEIVLAKNKIEAEKQFMQDGEKVGEYLKSQINLDDSNVPSYEMLNNFVQLAQGGMKEEMLRISKIDEEMANNTNAINRLEEILNTPAYVDDSEQNNQITPAMLIEPIVDIEQARYDQIKIMVDAQKKLEAKEQQIKELKENKVKSVVSKSCRQLLSQYKSEYNNIILDTYSKLDNDGIALVEAPNIVVDREHGQVSIASAKNKYPENFDELVTVTQVFWNIEEYRDEILNYGILSKEDIEKLTTIQQHCVKKLFSYTKNKEGFYEFSIEEGERDYLLHCQDSIVCLAKALYEARLNKTDVQGNLDSEIVDELKSMGLEVFNKEELQRKIFSLTKANDALKNEKDILVEKCKDSMIEGIDSVEEAILYRDMLVGIDEYYVSTDEIMDVLKVR